MSLYIGAIMSDMGQNERQTSRATRALAASIREAQGKADMTTAELARVSGVPYSTLRKIRKGDQPIDWEEVRKLATAMHIRSSVIAARAEEIEESTSFE